MYDESNDQGTTLEDQKGEVFEWEAYQDVLDKQECENKCWFSWMEFHKYGCPLYSDVDARIEANNESNIDIARGK
jgi:hypothetical protein